MSLDVPTISRASFSAQASHEPPVLRLVIGGTADVDAKADLTTVIEKVHAESLRVAAQTVVVDLRQLEFMNSACFKIFVKWLSDVRQLKQEEQYRVRLLSNPSYHWQGRSLAALSCFAVDLVAVES